MKTPIDWWTRSPVAVVLIAVTLMMVGGAMRFASAEFIRQEQVPNGCCEGVDLPGSGGYETLADSLDRRLRRIEQRLEIIGPGSPRSHTGSSLEARYAALIDREARAAEIADSVLAGVPNLNPAPGTRLTSGYAARRYHPIMRRVRPHWGVDLSGPRGTPVVATAGGKVAAHERTPELGLRIDIDHGNGFITRYAHLDATLVTQGQTVSAGQMIGRLGSSGLATGPVLHYEVYFEGHTRDPIRFLPHTLNID